MPDMYGVTGTRRKGTTMDLDELLTASAPPVTDRAPQLERELHALVADSEEAARPSRRWPVRVALVGGALAGVVGLGTVASATGFLPGWPSLSTPSGETCRIEISATALEPGEGEAISSTFSSTERDQALTATQAFLAAYDYDAVDRDEAVAAWQAEEAEVRAAQTDPAERQPKLTGEDLEVQAMWWAVQDDLRTHLTAQGLDIRAVSLGVGSRCEQ